MANPPDFLCIYSGKRWPEASRTLEHIVPYALGGGAGIDWSGGPSSILCEERDYEKLAASLQKKADKVGLPIKFADLRTSAKEIHITN
jgi:hypothetical protein